MGHFPMSGSQWQNGGQPPYYYYPQPQPEGFNTALQVSAAPEFGFGAHGNPAFSIDPAKLAEPLNPDLSIGVSHASGTGVPSFSVAGSMSTRRHLLQVRHKEAVYDILLQSSHKAEAAERVSSLAKDHNDDGYKTEFDKACLHHPKDSLTGRRKAEQRRTREPKFQCILCQDKMTTNNNLQNHYRSHLSLRKFQCPHCFTSFATDSIRARHLRNTVKCSGYNPNAVPKSKKEPSNKASNEHRASGSGTQ
ncbi:hypothetical protein CPB83DRAFT_406634 [Crepidotus variabilis]|uniref:C2H2-type domain-containing protein n=1 Tax=Crepidotus variabilis TaxID=179855 RepID=A0A9P6ERI2_9AGAR|nr:hypothetical protein CPB83DRAFT_406634 [Crepidotus variabilis]